MISFTCVGPWNRVPKLRLAPNLCIICCLYSGPTCKENLPLFAFLLWMFLSWLKTLDLRFCISWTVCLLALCLFVLDLWCIWLFTPSQSLADIFISYTSVMENETLPNQVFRHVFVSWQLCPMDLSNCYALVNTVPHQNQAVLDAAEESQASSAYAELTLFTVCLISNLVTSLSWRAAIPVLGFKHLT